ncbi:hypothetical protein A9Z40_03150 [Microbacterium arborescens]|uniref:Tape measure protein N-terminal domain-containing protein n=1 Tax=Microbacterium arborescens TaxID=33883 RepID=A0ABX2WIT6_9MICO|nr:hypothetical protein A9Z40_03150 [Microbacterium arborescens]
MPSFAGGTEQIVKELAPPKVGEPAGKKIGASMASAIGSTLKSAATGVVAVSAGALGTALVKGLGRLKNLDQANAKLSGLGHSAETVDAIMKNALASVKGTAFGMDTAATVAASSVAAGIKPGKELERTLKLVADAATIAGVDMGSMGGIFNKVAASNKVQMDVINQLHDAGVPALAALADYMGVTAEEASKMASSGAIDFETFQAAMEKSLGGAAQSSGSTFSGAMANVGAALGRVGAGIMGGFFPKLAPLFQAASKALGPIEDQAGRIGEVIGEKLNPVLDWLTRALESGLSGFKVAPQILAPAAAAFFALGSSGLAPLLRMVPGLGGFASKLALLGGPVGIAIAAFAGLVAVSPELQSALGTLLSAVAEAGGALAPVLTLVADTLAVVLPAAINVAVPIISGIVTALAGLISWVTQTDGVLNGLAITVGIAAAAWGVYKGVTAAISFAGLIAQLAAKTRAFVLSTVAKAKDMAVTVAIVAMYAKDFIVAVARSAAGVAAATGRWIAQTAAIVASRAALVAATAAQWLMNAALSANPIGIIIALVAALVGALIWFFTQTELGQEIWANFTRFLGEAWENIVAFAVGLWNGLGEFFVGLWQGIVDTASGAWNGLVEFFVGMWQGIVDFASGLWNGFATFFSDLWTGITSGVNAAINAVRQIILSVVVAIVSWWNSTWNGVSSFFAGLWDGITSRVNAAINAVRSVILSVVGAIVSWWRSTWDGVSSFFAGIWNGLVNTVRSVGSAFGSVFGGIRDTISNAFAGIVGIVKAPINGIIGLVNGAIRALNGLSVSIPDWVPGIGGSTFGVNLPTIPRLAKGATVLPRAGGTMAILAEAGRPESVVDTGLMNRALKEGLAGDEGGSGTVVHGPLLNIEHVTVDSKQRVEELSQALHERAERAKRSKGKVNLEGATT